MTPSYLLLQLRPQIQRTGDSSSNTCEEEDWDRMDSASDLDAAANALQVADDGGAVRKGE
jgi:hypothetical protein